MERVEGIGVSDAIDRAAAALADTRAGWVTRRDAADALGNAAERALRALNAYRNDKDVDIKSAVVKALGRASGGLAGVVPKSGYSLEDLAAACAKSPQRTVKAVGEGYEVDVDLGGGRRQRVALRLVEQEKGRLLRISTECGPSTPDAMAWALRANTRIALGALELEKNDVGDEQLVIRACFLPNEVTPATVKVAVKELAYYGDWIEQKLGGAVDKA